MRTFIVGAGFNMDSVAEADTYQSDFGYPLVNDTLRLCFNFAALPDGKCNAGIPQRDRSPGAWARAKRCGYPHHSKNRNRNGSRRWLCLDREEAPRALAPGRKCWPETVSATDDRIDVLVCVYSNFSPQHVDVLIHRACLNPRRLVPNPF